MDANKREYLRKNCLVPVRYTYEGQQQTHYARVVNYCDGGVCLKTRTPIPEGAKLNLSLEGYAPDGSYGNAFEQHAAAVCWSKQLPERGLPVYEIGVRYMD
jgi:hypothetical protein